MTKHPKTHPTLEDTHSGSRNDAPLGYWGEWCAYCPACAVKFYGPLPSPYADRPDHQAALAASGGKDTRDTITPFWPDDVMEEDDVILCDECVTWIFDHVTDWSKR